MDESPRTNLSVEGFRIGHATHSGARTGCTVLLCEDGARGGVDVPGAAPASLETDTLRPGGLSQTAHAVLLTGGSAFGLHAAAGVQRKLEEQGHGFFTGTHHVPIVPAAAIYDLGVGDGSVRPGPEMGERALNDASSTVSTGLVGGGTGATVGKAYGPEHMQTGGFGVSVASLNGDVRIGAAVVVNTVGDVTDPENGDIIAGARDDTEGTFLNSEQKYRNLDEGEAPGLARNNTIIGALFTNAPLSCEQCCRLARSGFAGVARCVRPVGTMSDGDLLFALSSHQVKTTLPMDALIAAVPDVVQRALLQPFRSGEEKKTD